MEKELVKVVNSKSVQLDEVLDEVQRFGRVWFKNLLMQGLKVGTLMLLSKMTIITCCKVLHFSLI